MLSDIEPYLDFERRILYRTGVIRRASMRQSLCRTFEEMDRHYADMMIEFAPAQRNGFLPVSWR